MHKDGRRQCSSRPAFPLSLFEAVIAAVDPARCVPPNLLEPPQGCTIVIGAGKSVASMARVIEERLAGDLLGLVVRRYGHAVPTSRIQVREAAHPVPDAAGLKAARPSALSAILLGRAREAD